MRPCTWKAHRRTPARRRPWSGRRLLNAMLVEAVAELVRRGVEPPILVSQNTDNFKEHNDALRARYRGRIRPVT